MTLTRTDCKIGSCCFHYQTNHNYSHNPNYRTILDYDSANNQSKSVVLCTVGRPRVHYFNLRKGIASCSDENDQNHARLVTKLFRPSPDVPHEDEDTPVVRIDGKNTMLLF